VNESKVCAKLGVVQVVKVFVDLNGRQETFVDDVGGGKRANVEPLLQCDGVSGFLAKNVKLTFKVFGVE
jgi:hypothetical protein